MCYVIFLFICPHLCSKYWCIWPRAPLCLDKLIHWIGIHVTNCSIPWKLKSWSNTYMCFKLECRVLKPPKHTNSIIRNNVKIMYLNIRIIRMTALVQSIIHNSSNCHNCARNTPILIPNFHSTQFPLLSLLLVIYIVNFLSLPY